MNTSDPILRISQVEEELGLKKSAIYKLVSEGELHKPVKITGRASGWLLSWVNEYKQKRIALSATNND